jgi:hypothetical protein
METRDLERIRFVTRYFNDLQGLRYGVPLGLITLAWEGPAPLRAGLFLAAFLLVIGAKRYYRNTVGEVERPPIDPAVDLSPVSLFHPGGPVSRLNAPQVTPAARHLLVILGLAVIVFSFFQSIPPNLLITEAEAPGLHPRVSVDPANFLGASGSRAGLMRSPSMLRGVFAQTMYLLYGSLFLGIWLWRERHPSQGRHLAFAVLLLGCSALGTSLGYFVGSSGEVQIPRFLDPFLPALVYPEVALLLCGSSMVLTGLLDHWQLVRALGRPVETEEEEEYS